MRQPKRSEVVQAHTNATALAVSKRIDVPTSKPDGLFSNRDVLRARVRRSDSLGVTLDGHALSLPRPASETSSAPDRLSRRCCCCNRCGRPLRHRWGGFPRAEVRFHGSPSSRDSLECRSCPILHLVPICAVGDRVVQRTNCGANFGIGGIAPYSHCCGDFEQARGTQKNARLIWFCPLAKRVSAVIACCHMSLSFLPNLPKEGTMHLKIRHLRTVRPTGSNPASGVGQQWSCELSYPARRYPWHGSTVVRSLNAARRQ